MIYEIVFVIVVLNLLTDMLEILLPSKKLASSAKTFVLVVLLFVICEYLFKV